MTHLRFPSKQESDNDDTIGFYQKLRVIFNCIFSLFFKNGYLKVKVEKKRCFYSVKIFLKEETIDNIVDPSKHTQKKNRSQ
jgi:ASC-1-like (ASCH) protein